MQLTIYCVTGIGLLKRIRCDSMLVVFANRSWRRGEHDGVDAACICENQVCAVFSVRHLGMQVTIYCVTSIGLLKRIRCDSMLPMYASCCWRRGENDGVDDVCASENQQVRHVCTVSHIGMQLTIYCVT